MKPNLKESLFFNIFYKVFAMLSPLITTPYLSRVLGAGGVGIQSYTLTIVNYFILVGCLGIGTYGVREISRNRDDKEASSRIFWELIIVKAIVFLTVFASYLILILTSKQNSKLYIIWILMLLSGFFDITWFFEGNEKFKTVAIKNMFFKIVYVILTLTLVKGENALQIYILIYAGTELISMLSLWFGLPKMVCKVKIKTIKFSRHFKQTFVYFIPAIASSLYTTVDKAMLKWILENDSEVGYYEQSRKIISVLESIIFSFNGVISARMSLLYKEEDYLAMKDTMLKSFDFVLLIIFPIIFGVCAVANTFVPIFFGSNFDKVKYLIPLMCPLVFIISISCCLAYQYITPSGKQNKLTIATLIGLVMNLILNLILIPIFESYGAVIASIIAEITITVLYLIISKEFVKFRELLPFMWKRLIASIIMFITVFLLNLHMNAEIWCLLIQIAIGMVIYFLILLILKDGFIFINLKRIKNKLKKSNTTALNNENLSSEDNSNINIIVNDVDDSDIIQKDDEN